MCLLILLLGSYIALRSSYVQTKITQYIAGRLSEELKTKIEIKGVDIAFFSTVILEGLYVEDQHQDTLASIGKLKLHLKKLNRKKQHITLRGVTLVDPDFRLRTYEGEEDMNLQFIIDAFASKDTTDTTSAPPWTIDVLGLAIENGHFILDNQNKPFNDFGMDYDHLDVRNIDLDISDVAIKGDTIQARINSLAATEKSGIVINKLSTNATVCSTFIEAQELVIETANSKFFTDLTFSYDDYNAFNNFIEEVKMDADILESDLSFKDITYFAPDLEGLNTNISIIGEIKGTVDRLKGRDVDFIFGDDTHFEGNVELTGLPDIERTLIYLTVKKLTTSSRDLAKLPVPPFNEKQYLELPSNMDLLGVIDFKGKFTGFYNDFVAYGRFNTALGSLSSDLSMKRGKNKEPLAYKGLLKANSFNVGKFFGLEESLGRVTLDATLDGAGLELDYIKANMKGSIQSIELLDYSYKNIQLSGDFANNVFDGELNVEEENIALDFNGIVDFTGKLPHFDFVSNIRKANLTALNLLEDSVDILVAANIELDFIGTGIDTGTGNVLITDFTYLERKKKYEVNKLRLSIDEGVGSKLLRLESDIADADFIGKFKFADLPGALSAFMLNYIPSYKPKEGTEQMMADQAFDFKVELKETDLISHLFLPGIKLKPGGKLRGTFSSSKGDFFLTGEVPEMDLNNTKIETLKLISTTNTGILDLSVYANKAWISDSIAFENVKVNTLTSNDSSKINLNWKNASTTTNRGNVNALVSFAKDSNLTVQFLPSEIWIQDSLWQVKEKNKLVIDTNSYAFTQLEFYHKNQKIRVNGKISENPDDKLSVYFNDFELGNFNPFTVKNGFNLSGKISGSGMVSDIYDKPNFNADLRFIKLIVNKEELGDGSITSKWDKKADGVYLKGKFLRGPIPTIGFDGYYYAQRHDNNFDFDLSLEKTQLRIFDPYVNNMLSNLNGMATGNLRLEGSPTKPKLTGDLTLQKVGFKVDYLNTSFSFTDDIKLEENAIIFSDLLINDYLDITKAEDKRIFKSRSVNEGKTILNGRITHNYFSDFQFDLTLDARNMQFMNTTASANELYYGRAFASGLIGFSGTPKNVVIDIAAKTERFTEFNIPLYGASETSASNFISFVSAKDKDLDIEEEEVNQDEYQVDLSSIQLNFDLEVTPDAEVQLIFDPTIGDIIRGRGNGNIKMEINTIGNFKMYGDYIIEDGDYLFTLQNLINKRFSVQQGGTVKWSGSPYDAYIDLQAIYGVRTNLMDLMYSGEGSLTDSEIEKYSKRVQVNCVMNMTGSLMNPNIDFDLDLPNSDQSSETEVKAKINTEEEMNRQIFSLLLMRRFFNPENLSGKTSANAFASNSSELLSNQLTNWLSQISKDFDLGVNYQAGDETTAQEIEVALSTQLFNNRVILDGNVGVSNSATSTANTSTLVGDFNVEYKITRDGRLRVKAFNETNDLSTLTNNAPYTQGVGLSYRKEFDTFGDLWRSIFKKKEGKKEDEVGVTKEQTSP